MKHLTWVITVVIMTLSINSNARVIVCGNAYGVVQRCWNISEVSCDDEALLELLARVFPYGWTCHQLSSMANINNAYIIQDKNQSGYIVNNGDIISIATDAFETFLMKLAHNPRIRKLSQQKLQKKFENYLKRDKSNASDSKLKEISIESGIPIKMLVNPEPNTPK